MDEVSQQKRRRALQQATKVMVEAARDGRLLTYTELTERITAVEYAPNSTALETLLGQISRKSNAEKKGMLSVVVVNKRTRIPGARFFVLAEQLGRVVVDREAFFRAELHRVREAWRS